MTRHLIAYCGLYCGACSFKVAFEQNDRTHLENMPDKYASYKNQPLEPCPGCRLEERPGKCAIKDCARNRQIADCSQCGDFPCDTLVAFNDDGIPHHSAALENLRQLKEIGAEKWIAQQEKKWTCRCGAALTWYKQTCGACP